MVSGLTGMKLGRPLSFNLTAQGKLIGPLLHQTQQGAYYILFGLGKQPRHHVNEGPVTVRDKEGCCRQVCHLCEVVVGPGECRNLGQTQDGALIFNHRELGSMEKSSRTIYTFDHVKRCHTYSDMVPVLTFNLLPQLLIRLQSHL